MASAPSPSVWAVVPAAGRGSRLQADRPKQYLRLLGQAILWRTLDRLSRHPRVQGIVVGLSATDTDWPNLPTVDKLIASYPGGAHRADTVLNGLRQLAGRAQPDDWILVHDAARPLVRHADIDDLLNAVAGHSDGGLLAIPVSDTVKRADRNGEVAETVDRSGLWRAQTPQIFPYQRLLEALDSATRAGISVTDEAAAMERLGARPRLVHGHADNIKITVHDDLALAELYLRAQEQETG